VSGAKSKALESDVILWISIDLKGRLAVSAVEAVDKRHTHVCCGTVEKAVGIVSMRLDWQTTMSMVFSMGPRPLIHKSTA
jgi:hypothetical protein